MLTVPNSFSGIAFAPHGKINSMAFNHLLWQAYAQGRPYPSERSGKNLRQAAENRGN